MLPPFAGRDPHVPGDSCFRTAGCGREVVLRERSGSYHVVRNMPPQAEADALGEKVMDVIARTQKLPREKVTLDSTFEQLNIDSLDGINIVFELEKEFGIDIPDDGVAKLRNVGDTVQGVRELLEKKHQPVTSEPA